MKFIRNFLIILFIPLISSACLVSTKNSDDNLPADRFFETPEETTEAFFQSIAELDFNKALSCFASKTKASRYDFKYMLEYMWSYTPSMYQINSYPFYENASYIDFLAHGSRSIRYLTLSILDPEFDFYRITMIDDPQLSEDMISRWDPAPLKNLQLALTEVPFPEIFFGEKYTEQKKRRAAIFQAEDIAELIFIIQVGDRYFTSGMSFIKFEQGWCIDTLSSSLAGTSAMGVVNEMTKYDFEEYMKSSKD